MCVLCLFCKTGKRKRDTKGMREIEYRDSEIECTRRRASLATKRRKKRNKIIGRKGK